MFDEDSFDINDSLDFLLDLKGQEEAGRRKAKSSALALENDYLRQQNKKLQDQINDAPFGGAPGYPIIYSSFL